MKNSIKSTNTSNVNRKNEKANSASTQLKDSKISANMSFRQLEAAAKRQQAIAIATAKALAATPERKVAKPRKRIDPLEISVAINRIKRLILSQNTDSQVVEIEIPKKKASDRFSSAVECFNVKINGTVTDRYSFYPSVYNRDHLGEIVIYGQFATYREFGANAIKVAHAGTATAFGFRIKKTTAETGLAGQYLRIKLCA